MRNFLRTSSAIDTVVWIAISMLVVLTLATPCGCEAGLPWGASVSTDTGGAPSNTGGVQVTEGAGVSLAYAIFLTVLSLVVLAGFAIACKFVVMPLIRWLLRKRKPLETMCDCNTFVGVGPDPSERVCLPKPRRTIIDPINHGGLSE